MGEEAEEPGAAPPAPFPPEAGSGFPDWAESAFGGAVSLSGSSTT